MMRTISLTKVNILHRTLFVMILLLAFMVCFILAAKPVHAASLEGDYTLDKNFTNVTALPDDMSTEFDLYKVGSFVSGSPYVKLDSPYDQVPVNLPLAADDTDKVAWTKEWLECASTLSNYIPEDAESIKIPVNNDGHFSVSGLANGIYLLKGESKEIDNYPIPGQMSYWWPQPMLISILDGDVKVAVKPMTEKISQLKVRKVWEKEGDLKDLIRPESITVKIYYGTKDEEGLRFTQELNQDNDWSYSWKTAKGEYDPNKWMVEEVFDEEDADKAAEMAKNYSVVIGTNFVKDSDKTAKGDVEILTITNTYDRYELEILKEIETAYIDSGEGASTSLVFELSGYDENDSRVYHKFVGMQFDKNSKDVQKLPVKDIPRGLKTLKVKEVYSGSYDPDDREKVATLEKSGKDDKGIYKVSFKNKPGIPVHGSGIINKFKIKDKDNYEFDKSLGTND